MIFRTDLQLRYSDSDQMGVVYHANYFSFFEQGRTNMLKEFGVNYYSIEEKGFIFPVRDVDCTYYKSIRLGEEIHCDTEILKLTKVKIQFEHKLYNKEGELKAVGHSSIICVKKDDFTIAKLDVNLPEVFSIREKI